MPTGSVTVAMAICRVHGSARDRRSCERRRSRMSAPVEVLMAVSSDRPRAEVTIDALKQMDKRGDIDILDAALVEKDLSGKVRIDEVKELTPRKGAGRGALVGGAIGLIFPPSLLASA